MMSHIATRTNRSRLIPAAAPPKAERSIKCHNSQRMASQRFRISRPIPSLQCATGSSQDETATAQATVLGGDGFTIATTEHCLAAFAGFEIDNAVVEVDGAELPIGDGSAQTYMDALEQAGSEEQNAAREYIVITERVVFGDDETFAAIEPYPGLRISCSIAFSHRRIGNQSLVLDLNPQSFKREIGPARTFGFLKDRERAKAMGLGLGAALENTVVLDDAGVLNAGGLRFPDEFVRHKMLDALGDLAVLGRPVRGHLEARCSGHEVMQGLVKMIAATEGCYRREEL